MFLKQFLRTFSNPRVRFLLNNRNVSLKFGSYNCVAPLSTTNPAPTNEKIKVTFLLQDGKRLEAEANAGDSLLDVVVNSDLNIEGFGACEGTVTCSTCHVILKPEDYARLSEEASDEEKDMLDLAYGLTDTSRLGCQVVLSKELDGLEVKVPETINDARKIVLACVCSVNEAEGALHLLDSPKYGRRRYDVESKMRRDLTPGTLLEILADRTLQPILLTFIELIVKDALARNKSNTVNTNT